MHYKMTQRSMSGHVETRPPGGMGVTGLANLHRELDEIHASSPHYTIAVVARTLDVLEALAAADTSLGATDLARRVGTTKSAAYRILTTLEERGYVIKDARTAEYRLGGRFAYLSRRAYSIGDLRQHARPLLEALHHRFHETINLGVPDGSEIVYIDMVESDQGLRMSARLGGRDPLHSTSLGKAILAFLPERERERILASPLPSRTGRTSTDAATLRAALDGIRRDGVAEDRGENEAGALCFGAPIFDAAGTVVAAVSVSSPESRVDAAREREIAAAVRETAGDITHRIGGSLPPPMR
jgi:IclR family transcriptional regulator, KDG regulon repressor